MAADGNTRAHPVRRTAWVRPVALVIAVVYLVLGIAGFFVPSGGGIGDDPNRTLWIFSVSSLQNVVHVVIGVLGLLAARSISGSRFYGWGLFAALAGFTAYGIAAAATGGSGDLVNTNWANNVLHGVTAVIALMMALFPPRIHRDQ